MLVRVVLVGLFVCCTPTIPFHTVLILVLAPIVRGNLVTALASSILVSNPLTIPLQYYLSWKIGSFLFPVHVSWPYVKGLTSQLLHAGIFRAMDIWSSVGLEIVVPLIVGGVILAFPLAVAGYFMSLYLYYLRQRRRIRAILASYDRLPQGGEEKR